MAFRLEEILETERRTLTFRAEDDARMREQFLDSLPPDPAGQIQELQDYRFADPGAQQAFDELMAWLREQVLGSYFRNMAQGMQNLSPEDMAGVAIYLSSRAGAYVTGAVIPVDGGIGTTV